MDNLYLLLNTVTNELMTDQRVKGQRVKGGREMRHMAAARFLTPRSPSFQSPSTVSLQSAPVGHVPADLCC